MEFAIHNPMNKCFEGALRHIIDCIMGLAVIIFWVNISQIWEGRAEYILINMVDFQYRIPDDVELENI